MITYKIITKLGKELEEELDKYFTEYHPAGYGTAIKKVTIKPVYFKGELLGFNYEVEITRFESCD